MNLTLSVAARLYALALRAFPRRHRAMYRSDMIETFAREVDRRRAASAWSALRFCLAACVNVIIAGAGERRRARRQHAMRLRDFSPATFWRDLVYAARTLMTARAFTVVSVASLGLGMGTVLIIFMFMRVMIGAPASIETRHLTELLVAVDGDLRSRVGDWAMETWSYPDYEAVRRTSNGLTVTGWVAGEGVIRLTNDSAPFRAKTLHVSPEYFGVLGVTLDRGSGFDPSEQSSDPVAIVAHRFWQTRLHSDPSVIGTTVVINGRTHTIVGIAPEGFRRHRSPEEQAAVNIWLPLSQHARLSGPASDRFDRHKDWVHVLGRLSPHTSVAEADGRVAATMRAIAEQFPETNGQKRGTVRPYVGMGALRAETLIFVQTMLVGISGLVLAVVCMNISGMVLARNASRERELAVRVAIGASRARVIQALLAESLVLAVLGAILAAGVLFTVPAALSWYFQSPLPDPRLRPDLVSLAIVSALCVVTSLVLGLLPALRFSRPGVITALKDDAGGGRRRAGKVHRFTAAAQAALAIPFLVICGIKLDNVRTTATAPRGFNPEHLFAIRVDGPTGEPRQDASFFRTIKQTLETAPGVQSVALGNGLPLDFDAREMRVSRPDDPARRWVHVTRVSPEYLHTLEVPVIRGRGLTTEDRAGSELVTLVSEPLAQLLFANGAALDQPLALPGPAGTTQLVRIVGITADVVTSQMATSRLQLFLPLEQHPTNSAFVIVRATTSVEGMQTLLTQAIPGIERELVQTELTTGDDIVRRSVTDLFSHSAVAGACAFVALSLTALGVFGIISFMVATRTREIGVRIALGASRGQVLGVVLRDAVKIVSPGVVLGLILAVWFMKEADDSWYSLGVIEPLTYVVAAASTVAVVLLSGLPSARRAASVEPIVAMRAE